jgi:hypothetical protein
MNFYETGDEGFRFTFMKEYITAAQINRGCFIIDGDDLVLLLNQT